MKYIKTKLFVFLSMLLVISLFTIPVFATSDESNTINEKFFNFPVNENGFTYGSILDAHSFENEPDLILAIGRCGTEGYVYAKDLYGPMPNTPEEALEIMEQRSTEPISIPLYAYDGENVIGEYIIDPPSYKLYNWFCL